MSEVSAKVTEHSAKIAEQTASIADLQQTMSNFIPSIDSRFESLNSRVDDLNNRVEDNRKRAADAGVARAIAIASLPQPTIQAVHQLVWQWALMAVKVQFQWGQYITSWKAVHL